MITKYTKEQVEQILKDHLNEGLEGINADYSFRVKEVNLETEKFVVEFDIVQIDDYIGLCGY